MRSGDFNRARCRWFGGAFAWWLGLLLLQPVQAHKVSSASLILYLNTEQERNYRVEVAMQVESSGDAALDDQIGPEEAALSFVESYLSILIDEEELKPEVSSQLVNESDPDTPKELQRLVVIVTMKGDLPGAGKELALFLGETSPMSIVMATVKNGVPARRMQVMFGGEWSRSENIEPLEEGDPFEKGGKGSESPGAAPPDQGEAENPAGEGETGGRFLHGVKAILFQTGLPALLLAVTLLPMSRFRWQLASWLGLAVGQTAGMLGTSAGPIPSFGWAVPACAVCLIVLAVDNFFSRRARAWRVIPALAGAAFLGMAMAQESEFLRLGSLPLDTGALVPFQAGLVAVLLGATLLVGALSPLHRRAVYRGCLVIPVSLIGAGVALFHIAAPFI